MLNESSSPFASRRTAASAQDPSLMPTLAVMLLLLAFFIMLVSMATYDAGRTKDVLDSLSATFAANPGDAETDINGGGETAEAAIGRVATEIGILLATFLRNGSYKIETSGAVAVVSVDNSELFTGGITPSPALDKLASRVARLVGDTSPGLHFEIEAVEPFGEIGATRRAGVVVRALESAGIAAGSLMTGLATSTPGTTRIEINVATREIGESVPGTLP